MCPKSCPCRNVCYILKLAFLQFVDSVSVVFIEAVECKCVQLVCMYMYPKILVTCIFVWLFLKHKIHSYCCMQ